MKINYLKFDIKTVIKFIGLWPPYLGTGITPSFYNDDVTIIDVEMKQTAFNTNYVGSHFGGSLYSMCDPWYMFILLHHLGREHIVWDKSAEIKFVSPGKGKVNARFEISMAVIEDLREQAKKEYSLSPVFSTEVKNAKGEIVALIKKELYIRRKDAVRVTKG
jgi:acyl-coenzyme A thioesterase PaaI-like protein